MHKYLADLSMYMEAKSFSEYRIWIERTLESQDEDLKEIKDNQVAMKSDFQKDMGAIKSEIATLKTTASLYGGAFGFLGAIVLGLIFKFVEVGGATKGIIWLLVALL